MNSATGPVSHLRKAHQLAISRHYSKAINLYRQVADTYPDLADISQAMIEACTSVCRRHYLGEESRQASPAGPRHDPTSSAAERPLHPLARSPRAATALSDPSLQDDLLTDETASSRQGHDLPGTIQIMTIDPGASDIPGSNALIPSPESQLGMAIDWAELNPELGIIRIRGWLVDPQHTLTGISIGLPPRLAPGKVPGIRRSHREDLRGLVLNLGIAHHRLDQILSTAGYEISLFVSPQPDARPPGSSAIEALQISITVHSDSGDVCLSKQLSHHGDAVEAAKLMIDQMIGSDMEVLDPDGIRELSDRWAARAARLLTETPQHRRHGLLDRTPDLSVVIPLYGRIDFMEYQLNWFNSWQRRLGDQSLAIQLIYVLDDPRLKEEFKDLARRCSTLYQMPFEVVINPQNLGFAGANNAASAYAESEWLMLLNSDIIPASDHSFQTMVHAIQAHEDRIGALGARLMFENGDIQHLGMEFEKRPELDGVLGRVWLNDHPMKGLAVPIDEEQIQPLVEVEAATAACLLLRTDRFRALNGLSSQYIVGDFEDSDLCMKLRQQGLGIYVDPSASFYHLERQSVGSGDQRHQLKAKLVATNAITHHRLWRRSIENLKSEPAQSAQP